MARAKWRLWPRGVAPVADTAGWYEGRGQTADEYTEGANGCAANFDYPPESTTDYGEANRNTVALGYGGIPKDAPYKYGSSPF